MTAEYSVNLKNKTKNELILFIKELEGSREKLKLHIEKDYISKQKIKDYLKEEEERYKGYKRESETNENLKLGMWKHLGAKNMCEKILGIENIVTLD